MVSHHISVGDVKTGSPPGNGESLPSAGASNHWNTSVRYCHVDPAARPEKAIVQNSHHLTRRPTLSAFQPRTSHFRRDKVRSYRASCLRSSSCPAGSRTLLHHQEPRLRHQQRPAPRFPYPSNVLLVYWRLPFARAFNLFRNRPSTCSLRESSLSPAFVTSRIPISIVMSVHVAINAIASTTSGSLKKGRSRLEAP